MRKVEIRPLPRKHLNGTEQINLFKGRVLRAVVDPTTRKYKTGMTPKELKKYGDELGIDLSDKFIPGKPHPFWDSKQGTLKLGNYTVVLDLDNPRDYVLYKMASVHKWVAPSLDEYKKGGYADAFYYIVDENKEDKLKAKKLEVKAKALDIIKELDDEAKAQMALVLYDKMPSKFDNDKVNAILNDILETKPERIVELHGKDKKYMEVRSLFIKAIGYKVIVRLGGKYKFNSEVVGTTKEEAIANLLKDENDKLYAMIVERVVAKEKAKK